MSHVQPSRLAVYATAKGSGGVEGWIFLKVSLPNDFDEAIGGRYGLFPGPAPIRAQNLPSVHSLPLTRAPDPASPLAIAASLLSLEPGTAYPPRAGSSSTTPEVVVRPTIEVSKSPQVYLCVKPTSSPAHRRTLKRKDSFAGLSPTSSGPSSYQRSDGRRRQEWLVIVPFLTPLEPGYVQGVCAVTMNIPCCLANQLRLRIGWPVLADADEGFDVTTEPKTTLAVTREHSRQLKGHQLNLRDPNEEDWEDGELPDATNRSLGLDDDDDAGECLQGAFPSSPTLHIAWSPAQPGQSPTSHARVGDAVNRPVLPSIGLSAPSVIRLTPRVTDFSIGFHQTIPVSVSASQQQQYELHLQSILPPDWAWSALSVSGKSVGELRSLVTGDILGGPPRITETLSSEDEEVEDSFATVRGAPSTGRRRELGHGPSLLRQSLPANDISVDDFSFENHGGPSRLTSAPHKVESLADPICERDLVVTVATNSEQLDTTIVIEGTIRPLLRLQRLLPRQPLEIPFIRFAAVQGRQPCQIHLPATAARNIDLAHMAPTFTWPGTGAATAHLENVTVAARATRIGTHLVSVTGRYRGSGSNEMMEFALLHDGEVHLLSARVDGAPVRRGLVPSWQDWLPSRQSKGVAIVGLDTQGRDGVYRLLLEVASDVGTDGRVHIPLPVWKSQAGIHTALTLEDEYVDVDTNLTKTTSEHAFTGLSSVATPAYISYRPRIAQLSTDTLGIAPRAANIERSNAFKLISFRTFTILSLLYILASVVIEVHHLRRELATQNDHVEHYFAKQARTLDSWESRIQEQLAPVVVDPGPHAVGHPNDPQAFDKWLRHPAVSIAVSGVRRFLHVLKFLLTG